MHSSRMRTACSLTVSHQKNHARPPWEQPHPPGSNHACPQGATMHTPPGSNHACPLSNHAHPPSNHACPPGATMHTPPGATMHAPQATTHAPRATMHAPQATTHTPPGLPHTPSPDQPRTPPLWTE